MLKKKVTRLLLFILCLYDFYLYLPDLFNLFNYKVYLPTSDYMTYLDAAMLLFGGIVIGIMLIKSGHKGMGWLMIILNIILAPFFIWKALAIV